MKRIQLSDLAMLDLEGIWHYVAVKSGHAEIAFSFIESINRIFPLLASSPKIGLSRDGIEPGLRMFPTGKYNVYYREFDQLIVISRVIHGMRDQHSVYAR